MTIRMLRTEDRPQAQAMWQEIFEEEPAFTQWYFAHRFHPEYSFGAFENGALISMTLGRPTYIRAEGRDQKALLVAGVSTLPAYRGRGLMRELMTRLIDNAKANGFACCYLHPVSETLYASLGFRNGADILRVSSDEAAAQASIRIEEGAVIADLLSVYHAAMETHDGMQLRDETEFTAVLSDYASDNAKTWIAYDGKTPVGYLCGNDSGMVFELLAQNEAAYAALLKHIEREAGKTVHALIPVDSGLRGERLHSMQYLVFDNAFALPLKNGYCRIAY